MSVTAISYPNIALIKYWGNRNNELRLPVADSLSMTLDKPSVTVTVDHADTLDVESFNPDGTQRQLREKELTRFVKHVELMRRYLTELKAPDAIPASLKLTIKSEIPQSVGLASSSAIFSAIARAVSGLVKPTVDLTDWQTSVLARLGSGSACRGIGDGFVAIDAGKGDKMGNAIARPIADHEHWVLHDIIIVPSMEEKKVGSTEGHALAQTSPHFAARIRAIKKKRQKECIKAIIKRDFERLQRVAEEDCMDMHHVMQTSTPALHYLNSESYRIIDEIKQLRTFEKIPVLYTMDAGPTVHLFCPDEAYATVAGFAHTQGNCQIFEAKIGPGAHLIETPVRKKVAV